MQSDSIKVLYRGWVEAMGANPEMTLDEMRTLFDHWGDVTGEPGGVDYIEVDAGGVPAMWAIPKDCNEDRVVICTHGGGYVVGSMYSHRKVFGHLAKAIGCRALILNYRCAPEYPHPAPVEDAVLSYRWLLDDGMKPEHICTAGDSAGGGLCTTVLLAIRDAGLPMPAAAMPMSPWYDMELSGGSLITNAAKDELVQEGILASMAEMFLGSASPQDPLANPLYNDLAGLPPVYIQVGGDETLLDDAVRFLDMAKEAGVEAKLEVFPEMQHVFHFLAGAAPEGDDAIAKFAEWVRPKLGL
jgi:acetyl esterase/lipase